MSRFRGADSLRLQEIVRVSGNTFAIYIRPGVNHINIRATDGIKIWEKKIKFADVEKLGKELGFTGNDNSFVTAIRSDFATMTVMNKVETLDLHSDKSAIKFSLQEMKAIDAQEELQKIFFEFAQKAIDTEKDAARKAELAKADDTSIKDTDISKTASKKVGMSAINPTSKKRKAAHGVVYE